MSVFLDSLIEKVKKAEDIERQNKELKSEIAKLKTASRIEIGDFEHLAEERFKLYYIKETNTIQITRVYHHGLMERVTLEQSLDNY